MSELSCDTLFIGRNETHDLSRYHNLTGSKLLINECFDFDFDFDFDGETVTDQIVRLDLANEWGVTTEF